MTWMPGSRITPAQIRQQPELLREVPAAVQTEVQCLAAVQTDGLTLRYVKNQTSAVCEAAIEQNPHALQYVTDQTPQLCLMAVQDNPVTLKYVARKTPQICQAAIGRVPILLQFVAQQTDELCLTAVRKEGWSLQFVIRQTPEICLVAVQQVGQALAYVKEQTVELCVAAVTCDGRALEYVRLPHDRLEVASSGQLEGWLQVLRACEQTDEASIESRLDPLLESIPLGKQYRDEWSQLTPSGGCLLDRLVDFVAEWTRLAPDHRDVTVLIRQIQQQQEWILARRHQEAKHHNEATYRPEEDFTL